MLAAGWRSPGRLPYGITGWARKACDADVGYVLRPGDRLAVRPTGPWGWAGRHGHEGSGGDRQARVPEQAFDGRDVGRQVQDGVDDGEIDAWLAVEVAVDLGGMNDRAGEAPE